MNMNQHDTNQDAPHPIDRLVGTALEQQGSRLDVDQLAQRILATYKSSPGCGLEGTAKSANSKALPHAAQLVTRKVRLAPKRSVRTTATDSARRSDSDKLSRSEPTASV